MPGPVSAARTGYDERSSPPKSRASRSACCQGMSRSRTKKNSGLMRIDRNVGLTSAAMLLLSAVSPVAAQGEYRAFWVDTFNTTLNNHNDRPEVVAVKNRAAGELAAFLCAAGP